MFSISDKALDCDALKDALRRETAGACVTFEGWVRNHNDGKEVTRLEYEAYTAMAEKEGQRIVEEAVKRFDLDYAECVHRVGRLEIGEAAVWVGVSSAHRSEAFEACRFVIDEVKHRLPIWKKEHYADGDSGWVNCEACAGATVQDEISQSDRVS